MNATAMPWHPVELTVTVTDLPANPYTDLDLTVEFTHQDGSSLTRPAFWDGGSTWRVRFVSPGPTGSWRWRLLGSVPASPSSGTVEIIPGDHSHPHASVRHGFPRPAASGRALVHADGTPMVIVGDTPWAMPWRATLSDVEYYATDRQAKGFNAALLMSVQPDMGAVGPRERGVDFGFDVGFEDLPSGRLTQLNVDYFRYLDAICAILVNHGITPVLQPVFHGFGWKGQGAAGPVVPEEEYARYCRYLVARYGASPVIYLVGADGAGTEPQIAAGGAEIERVDCYGQPTGIHYRPHARNDAHQAESWLDFQWCQTGHEGEHVPERVTDMWHHHPAKPVLNGEPTYENSGRRGKGAGWWQGHEAWSNLCAGGTMGVVYGAGSLWQWRLHADEAGHQPFFLAEGAGWREALEFEGSRYVGLVGKILDGLPTTDLVPCWDVSLGTRGLLDPGVLYLGYLENGGPVLFLDSEGRVPSRYWLVDPRDGSVVASGSCPGDGGTIADSGGAPRLLICSETVPPFIK